MDDPDEDWEIDDQNTCEYLEGGGGGNCNVRWVLEKGLNLGKKVVITGFVMSSAPVVLPPILVVSAVGFACSVPFGLVFTGYACTQKLMSKLLPMSTASPMLEYDQMFDDQVEEVEGGEGKDRIESRVYMEEEERGQIDDLRAGVEESSELVKNENEVPREENSSKDIRRGDQMFDDEKEEVEGRREGNDQIESHVYMGIEESMELVGTENTVPQEGDDFENIWRDDELRVSSENISLKEEGYEEDVDEPLVYNNESPEEIGARAVTGQEEAINQESRSEELFPKDVAPKPSDWSNSRDEGKEKMGDLKLGVEERFELVKNENEVPREDVVSKDIRRDDELIMTFENSSLNKGREEDEDVVADNNESSSGGVEERIELVKNENEVPREDDSEDIRRGDEQRMTSENISMKEEGHEEDDDEPLVDSNESSEEMVAFPDVGQEESINQESKCKELFPKVDALKPSYWNNSREEEKEKMDDLKGVEESSIELVKHENEGPREDDDSKDIRRDDELRMTSENISLNKGHEEGDELVADDNESPEEMVARADVGQEQSINQESKSEELFRKDNALKPTDWSNSREGEKEMMGDLSVGIEERIELVKNENEVPHKDVDSEDIRRDDELGMTSENISPNKGHEEDDGLVVDNNESSKEIVARADVEQEESINQESKSEGLFPKDDALKPSDGGNSRDEEKEQMVDLREGVEESIESVKQEIEVPQEDDESKDIRAGDQLRMTIEDLSLKEGHEGDGVPIVYNNESSEEMVDREDVGQEESIVQERKSKELFPKEDALKNSDWTGSREVEGKWEVTELIIEGEENIGSEESIDGNIVGENVGPVVFGEFSESQTGVNNEEEDIRRGSVGLLEKIKDMGNADDAAKETKNKKKPTTEAEMLLLEVKDESAFSQNLTVGNGDTENQQSGHGKRKKLEDSREVGMQEPPVGGAAGSDDSIPLQENITSSYPLRESDETSSNKGADPMVLENVEVVEISVTAGRPKAEDAESSAGDSALPTEKEFVDEEKIREQIDALRTIVGYKSTTYRSSIEEVKALYTFTGVELPSSFGDPSDLAEVSNKLRFLMSILGVK